MALEPGSYLGSYEILSALGAGGMGEVYRARDTKLGRTVAVKVLPEALLAADDHVARFKREARALAALNHPNIASLFGMEEAAGRHVLVMELVEGDTLAECLLRGPMSIERALTLAHQIVEAMEAAHERGIVHRDLKPANIKITPDERVKVLDFGLAKLGTAETGAEGQAGTGAAPAALTQSPTLSLMATQAGVILGTAAYMSPEQAKGLTSDHRSDVFSFGSVLYEMLTGRAAFHGETAPDILATVLAREPDFSALPRDLNPRIHDLLRRCLEKNPKKRWQAVGDLRAEIETVLAVPRVASPAASGGSRSVWRRVLPLAITALVAAVVAGALTGAVVWSFMPRVAAPTVTRFTITLPEGEQFEAPAFREVAISPDGTQMVYAANQRLYLRSMSELTSRLIAGSETDAAFTGGPFFSPDGKSIAFWTGMDAATFTLKRIDVVGGVAVTICQTPTSFGGSWGPDGIVFAQARGIMRVSPNGGQPQLLVATSGETATSPQILPDGTSILFTLSKAGGATSVDAANLWDKAQVVVQSLTTGARKTVIDGGSDARYLPSGHLVYAVGTVLFAVPFEPRREEVTGPPVPVVEGVERGVFAGFTSGVAQFSVSETGSLVYVPAPTPGASIQRELALVDRKGGIEPLKLPRRPYEFPRISPDGKQLAYSIDEGKDANIWIFALDAASSPRQLTLTGRNRFPAWTPDGQRIAYQSDREGSLSIFWQRADGTAAAERLTTAKAGFAHVPEAWSPDGKTLLLGSMKDLTLAKSLLSFSLQDHNTTSLVEGQSTLTPVEAAFSPDGRWLAYSFATQSDTPQLFVQPFPATGANYLVATFARHPIWSRDGKELYFGVAVGPNRGQLMAVRITTEPAFVFGNATPVASGNIRLGFEATARQFDLTPDGKAFIGVVEASQTQRAPVAQKVQLVLNWFKELNARVPSR